MALKDEYFTISEAARELGVTRQTVSRWISIGVLTAEKIGRERLIEKEKVRDFHASKFEQAMSKAMVVIFIAYIREKYHFTEDDKIEQIGDNPTFAVTRNDGTREKIEIRDFGMKVKVTRNAIRIEMKPQNIVKTPYKEPKKGGKQNK